MEKISDFSFSSFLCWPEVGRGVGMGGTRAGSLMQTWRMKLLLLGGSCPVPQLCLLKLQGRKRSDV